MIKHNYTLYSLNIIALVVYFTIFFNLKTSVSEEVMFSTPDSETYLDVVNWMTDNVDSESVSIRPLLYPLILMVSTKLGGVYGIWIIQAIFWLLAINFTFLTIKQITKNIFFSFLGAFLLMSNLSLIALTLHALTEVTTVFLLSMMLFLLARKIDEYRSLQFFHICLFFMVLLTLTKPAFYIPLAGILFIILPLFYFKKYLKNPKSSLKLLLIILPLIIQISIIKVKYGQATVSFIGPKTLTEYFIPQGIVEVESISFENALKKSESLSKAKQMNYIKNHTITYLSLFRYNIKNNIKGEPTFLLRPKGYESHRFAQFMQDYNDIMPKTHLIFAFLIFPILLYLFKKKNIPILLFLVFPFMLGAYYIITTGVSFWQGDRLTLSSIAIWACIYPIILFFYLKILYPTKSQLDSKLV